MLEMYSLDWSPFVIGGVLWRGFLSWILWVFAVQWISLIFRKHLEREQVVIHICWTTDSVQASSVPQFDISVTLERKRCPQIIIESAQKIIDYYLRFLETSNSCCRSRAEDNMRDSTDPGKNLFLEKDIFILLLHGQSAYGTVFFLPQTLHKLNDATRWIFSKPFTCNCFHMKVFLRARGDDCLKSLSPAQLTRINKSVNE